MIDSKTFDRQVDRNLEADFLEKQGLIDKAIDLYEKNISENFEGNFPYDRLAIIYRKQSKREDEIRVLKHAIETFKNLPNYRPDKFTKLTKFENRLTKLVSN